MTRPMPPSPLTPPEQALEELFAAQARRMPEDGLTVTAVLARASTLRRRRTAYRSSVAVVAVLAAIPMSTELAHRLAAPPATSVVASTATATGTATVSPTSSGPIGPIGPRVTWAMTLAGDVASRQIELTMTGLRRGADVAVPYVTDPAAWRIVPPTGAPIALPALPAAQGRYGAPVRVSGGWLVPNYRPDGVSAELVRVVDDGRVVGRSVGGALAASTDGRTVAYTWAGRLIRESVPDGAQVSADFPAGEVSDVSVLDDGTVYLHDQAGGKVTEYRWRVGEGVAEWPGHGYLRGTWNGNTVLRDTVDAVPCSALLAADTETSQVRSCARFIKALSPDGRYAWVSGQQAGGYESGPGGIADLVTGQMVLDLVTTADGAPQVLGQAWEDRTHVLLVTTLTAAQSTGTSGTSGTNRWAVLRLGIDGTLELATDVVTGGDTTQFDLGRPSPSAP